MHSHLLMLGLAMGVMSASPADAQRVPDPIQGSKAMTNNNRSNDQNAYVGMWVTRDGYIRHELLPGGRYDEARGNRRSAYQGRYVLVAGNHIDYVDDTGFTADGEFRDGVLYHGGMVLYRENKR